jgi:hypothetical protein
MARFEYRNVINAIGTLGGYGYYVPKYVTIHHSAATGYLKDNDLDRFRLYKNYHAGVMPYAISIPYENDDLIYITQYLNTWTVHCGNAKGNTESFPVLVDGNFQTQAPLDVQLAKLKQVLDDIQTGWFQGNGYTLPQMNVQSTYLNDVTVNALWETIHVPTLHYHNEIAQKRYPLPGGGWGSAATACCGQNLIPKVVEYRDKRGKVNWDFISKEDEMYKEKYEAEVKKKWEVMNQLKDVEKEKGALKIELEACEKARKEGGDVEELETKNKALAEANKKLQSKNTKLELELQECKENQSGAYQKIIEFLSGLFKS